MRFFSHASSGERGQEEQPTGTCPLLRSDQLSASSAAQHSLCIDVLNMFFLTCADFKASMRIGNQTWQLVGLAHSIHDDETCEATEDRAETAAGSVDSFEKPKG
jgi:hypothetical protein